MSSTELPLARGKRRGSQAVAAVEFTSAERVGSNEDGGSGSGGPKPRATLEKRVSSEFVLLRAGASHLKVDDGHGNQGPQGSTDKVVEGPKSGKKPRPRRSATREDYDRISLNSLNANNVKGGSSQHIHRKETLRAKTDLEAWWLESPRWRRLLPFMCVTILVFGVCQLGSSIYFMFQADHDARHADPYVCRTPSCISMESFIEKSLDESVDPCRNFYKFVCGNYKLANNTPKHTPKHVDLSLARMEFNQKALIGNILVKTDVTADKILPYYKSCINTVLRKNIDNKTLIHILKDTLQPAFDDIRGFDIYNLSAEVAKLTGHFGLFRIKYEATENGEKQIVLLPPFKSKELAGFNITNSSDNGTIKFMSDLNTAYSILWNGFNFTNETLISYAYSEKAVDRTVRVLKVILLKAVAGQGQEDDDDDENSEVGSPVAAPATTKPTITSKAATDQSTDFSMHNNFAEKCLRKILDKYLDIQIIDGFNYTIIPSQVPELVFHPFDVYELVSILTKGQKVKGNADPCEPGSRVRKNLVSFWIYTLLWQFSQHLEKTLYNDLQLDSIFSPWKEHRDLAQDRFCIESLVENLGAHVVVAFQKQSNDVYTQNGNWLREIYYRTYRAKAKTFRRINSDFLYPDQAFLSRSFSLIQAGVDAISPFPTNIRKRKLLSQLSTMFDGYRPEYRTYLMNVYHARRNLSHGLIDLWKNNAYEQEFNFIDLEKWRHTTNNEVVFTNQLYYPITALDLPYIDNDIKVLDHAGVGLFLAKALIKLWWHDRGHPYVYIRGETEEQQNTFNNIPRYQPIKRQYQQCGIPPSQPDAEKLSWSPISNALAFKLAMEVYKNPTQYQSFIWKENQTVVRDIRFVYNEFDDDPQPKYYRITEEQANLSFVRLPPQIEDMDDYDTYESLESKHQRYKLKYLKLPEKLSKYDLNQLFFITAVRHNCFETALKDDNDTYMDEMNNALSLVSEFAEAFECPLGSPMSQPVKCF